MHKVKTAGESFPAVLLVKLSPKHTQISSFVRVGNDCAPNKMLRGQEEVTGGVQLSGPARERRPVSQAAWRELAWRGAMERPPFLRYVSPSGRPAFAPGGRRRIHAHPIQAAAPIAAARAGRTLAGSGTRARSLD
jgi:hypothetical protein